MIKSTVDLGATLWDLWLCLILPIESPTAGYSGCCSTAPLLNYKVDIPTLGSFLLTFLTVSPFFGFQVLDLFFQKTFRTFKYPFTFLYKKFILHTCLLQKNLDYNGVCLEGGMGFCECVHVWVCGWEVHACAFLPVEPKVDLNVLLNCSPLYIFERGSLTETEAHRLGFWLSSKPPRDPSAFPVLELQACALGFYVRFAHPKQDLKLALQVLY